MCGRRRLLSLLSIFFGELILSITEYRWFSGYKRKVPKGKPLHQPESICRFIRITSEYILTWRLMASNNHRSTSDYPVQRPCANEAKQNSSPCCGSADYPCMWIHASLAKRLKPKTPRPILPTLASYTSCQQQSSMNCSHSHSTPRLQKYSKHSVTRPSDSYGVSYATSPPNKYLRNPTHSPPVVMICTSKANSKAVT